MTFSLLSLWLLTGQRPGRKLKGESLCSQDLALERTAMLAQPMKFLLSTLLILLEFYFPLSLIFFKGFHFPTLYWFLYSNVFHVSLLKPDNFITCLQGGQGQKKKKKTRECFPGQHTVWTKHLSGGLVLLGTAFLFENIMQLRHEMSH